MAIWPFRRRVSADPVVTSLPPPRPRWRRWSGWGAQEERLESLKTLAASGRRLSELMDHPGWTEVLEAKEHYQSLATMACRNPEHPEAIRFRSAVEWATLEGFFKELRLRIKRGEQAQEKVDKLVK